MRTLTDILRNYWRKKKSYPGQREEEDPFSGWGQHWQGHDLLGRGAELAFTGEKTPAAYG